MPLEKWESGTNLNLPVDSQFQWGEIPVPYFVPTVNYGYLLTDFWRVIHRFHSASTLIRNANHVLNVEKLVAYCRHCLRRLVLLLIIQSFSKLIQHPVQILVGLPLFFNFVN